MAVLAILIAATGNAQTNFKTLIKTFEGITGNWQGSLTYLDYSTGKPYTMPADMSFKRINNTNRFLLYNIYPNEKSANSIDTITISTNGDYIGNEQVKSRRKLSNGDIEIITEERGKDGNDNKDATFRHTYIIGKQTCRIRKDVLFEGAKEWINRHEYVYKRNTNNQN
ncbi:hypothetical protein [Parasegetibacter sp. NRK P23]|uniref:hypothetical protein n=1 Tax=Parasegetibacter sp. NRK P23 TaxID=2942999 RepID=UPI00204421EB|nr:hypothetical protein [Parasegetibacter sp. NRK P23]MCM5530352.1 hypothetical protein [Parasegetibacter sp. NRK P23]